MDFWRRSSVVPVIHGRREWERRELKERWGLCFPLRTHLRVLTCTKLRRPVLLFSTHGVLLPTDSWCASLHVNLPAVLALKKTYWIASLRRYATYYPIDKCGGKVAGCFCLDLWNKRASLSSFYWIVWVFL